MEKDSNHSIGIKEFLRQNFFLHSADNHTLLSNYITSIAKRIGFKMLCIHVCLRKRITLRIDILHSLWCAQTSVLLINE